MCTCANLSIFLVCLSVSRFAFAPLVASVHFLKAADAKPKAYNMLAVFGLTHPKQTHCTNVAILP